MIRAPREVMYNTTLNNRLWFLKGVKLIIMVIV